MSCRCTIVIVGGYGNDAAYFEGFERALRRESGGLVRVVTIPLRHDACCGLADQVDMVRRSLPADVPDGGVRVLLGFSTGCNVVLELLREPLKVTHAVLFAPPTLLPYVTEELLDGAPRQQVVLVVKLREPPWHVFASCIARYPRAFFELFWACRTSAAVHAVVEGAYWKLVGQYMKILLDRTCCKYA